MINWASTIPFYGTIALILLHSANAIINETFNGYLFTIPDYPDNNQKTKADANQWCKDNKNALLEIYDSQLQGNVIQFISKKSEQNTYLGYRQIFTNGIRISTGAVVWVNGQTFIPFVEIKNQQNLDNAYVYLVLNQTGIFYIADSPVANKRGYIYEDASPSTCSGGFKQDNRCYRSTISTEQLSWFDARNRCLGAGGDLASFDFVNDYQSLYSLNGSWISPSTQYWIGLRREFWNWQESAIDPGSEIKYTNWQNGHPRPSSQSERPPSNCLCLTTSQQRDWSECDCSQNSQFLCATRIINYASTSTTTALATRPSTTPVSLFSKPTTSPGNTPSIKPSSSSSTPATSTPFSAYSGNYASTINSSFQTANKTSADATKSLAGPLGVGLGVGLGGLLIIIVVVVALIRKHHHRKCQSNAATVIHHPESEATKPSPTYESLQNRSAQPQDAYSSLAYIVNSYSGNSES